MKKSRCEGIKIKFITAVLGVLFSAILVAPVLSRADDPETAESVEGEIHISMIGKYDSADSCSVISIDEDFGTIKFRNHDIGRDYTLSFDKTTHFYDKHGKEVTVSSVETGMLVYATFLKSTKHLNSLSLEMPKDGWVYKDVSDYDLPVTFSVSGSERSVAKINGKEYKINYNTLVLVDGAASGTSSILKGDKIDAYGIGDEVYSIKVTSGHGYLRLSSDTVNDTSLIGAWIELDNKVIRRITEHMLMSAPEGEYDLYIGGNGASHSDRITIIRGKETVVDTSTIEIEEPKSGLISFKLTPKEAGVIVDGEDLGAIDEVSMKYGVHEIEIYAEGYKSDLRYLRVGSSKATVRLELAKESSSHSESSDKSNKAATVYSSVFNAESPQGASSVSTHGSASANNSGFGSSSSGNVIPAKYIAFESPVGAALYFDGNFVGTIPVTKIKVSGLHTVTLTRNGYKTVSYNIDVDGQNTDVVYRFPDMAEDKK